MGYGESSGSPTPVTTGMYLGNRLWNGDGAGGEAEETRREVGGKVTGQVWESCRWEEKTNSR